MRSMKAHVMVAGVLGTASAGFDGIAAAAPEYSFDMRRHAQLGLPGGPGGPGGPAAGAIPQPEFAARAAQTQDTIAEMQRIQTTIRLAQEAVVCIDSILSAGPHDCWARTYQIIAELDLSHGVSIDAHTPPDRVESARLKAALEGYISELAAAVQRLMLEANRGGFTPPVVVKPPVMPRLP
ncbi:hypothetical protein [Caballeronia sp. LZ043]|uniref:hypothetical protein n=1 Tax=Caballeronia sp. LZ043 TaxID=3038569 RepID=UPI002856203C|nr:hypothetical protein [Caballeronia sp. LZ043]MDR5825059.1 hypothetical protein [Caballeronia sp. LZ043]